MNVFRRAVQAWGKRLQLEMLQEECGEVVAAINQYKRGRISEDRLAEEIADLKIMVQQMWEIFDEDILEQAYARKIDRLDTKLSEVETTAT